MKKEEEIKTIAKVEIDRSRLRNFGKGFRFKFSETIKYIRKKEVYSDGVSG